MTVAQLSVLFLDMALQLSRLIVSQGGESRTCGPFSPDLCFSPISRWCICGIDMKLRAEIWIQGQGSMLGHLKHMSASRRWKRPPLMDSSPMLVRQRVGSGCSSTSCLSKSSNLPNKNNVVWQWTMVRDIWIPPHHFYSQHFPLVTGLHLNAVEWEKDWPSSPIASSMLFVLAIEFIFIL